MIIIHIIIHAIWEVLHLVYLATCISFLVVLISFCRSLQSRYYLYGSEQDNEDLKSKETVTSPCFSAIKWKSSSSLVRQILNDIPYLGNYLRQSDNDDTQREMRHCREALTDPNIRSIYKQISWRYTSIDFEAIDWLNQILRSFWPYIKIALNKLIFSDLFKPKNRTDVRMPKISKELNKRRAKLSVLFSSRRKMIDLWKSRRKENEFPTQVLDLVEKSVFCFLVYTIKLFVIYTRQFVMDYFISLLKPKETISEEASLKKVNLFSSLLKEETLSERSNLSTTLPKKGKINDGFVSDFCYPNRVVFKKKGGSGTRIICLPFGISIDKFRRNRMKLSKKFMEHARRMKARSNKDIIIEKIELGDSIPTLNGIKYIDNPNDSAFQEMIGEPVSDASDMKFLVEFSYNADNKFNIQMNSLPILDQISLTNIRFQLRLMITVNHTVTELNKNLDILDTPGDVLFPAINHIQVALVDIPKIDWHLKRPIVKDCRSLDPQRTGKKQRLINILKKFLDPVDFINHIYFKYLTHCVIYMTLRWFKPFDIKIGNHLYMKTIC